MENIITVFTDWPLIVQGAIGSGLFWVLLKVGQYTSANITKMALKYSDKRKYEYLTKLKDKYIGLKAHEDGDLNRAANITIGLIYQSLRSLFLGLVWLSLGLIFNSVIPVLGVVGFVGCIYYMFKGLGFIQAIDRSIPAEQRIKEINEELEEIKNKT